MHAIAELLQHKAPITCMSLGRQRSAWGASTNKNLHLLHCPFLCNSEWVDTVNNSVQAVYMGSMSTPALLMPRTA